MLESQIDDLEKQKSVFTSKIDALSGKNAGPKDTALGVARNEMKAMIAEKAVIMRERTEIFNRRDALEAQRQVLMNDSKKGREGIKFTKVEDIEKRMKELKVRQETVSMSLNDEKKLLKELEELQASKKVVAALAAKEADIATSKNATKDIGATIAEKNGLLKDVNDRLDAKKVQVEAMAAKEGSTKSIVPDLLKQRSDVFAKINDKFAEQKKLGLEFKNANNEWFSYMRWAKEVQRVKYEEEGKKRDAEKKEYEKKKLEEEMKKIPYEEEMVLCDYLVNYLITTYLNVDAPKSSDAAAAPPPAPAAAAPAKDPFAGMKAVSKGADTYLKMGKEKPAVKPAVTNRPKAEKTKTFALSLDDFEQFALLNLTPPVSFDAVPKSVEELKAKKIWFTQQERGAVPTAADIRKKSQKEAEKFAEKGAEKAVSPSENKPPGPPGLKAPEGEDAKKRGGKKAFVFSNDDFAPLCANEGSALTAAGSTWGKKEETAE